MQLYHDQGMRRQQTFEDWPLAVLLQIKKDLGDPNGKFLLCEHLLLAQVPTQLENVKTPLLEWRLAPTSEENKAKPDIVLSQVYLTFGRSRNSPDKDPTLRLWLAAKIEGKRKRILLADASVNFATQVRSSEVRLFQTERCKNPDLIFVVHTLPGIHFFQSNTVPAN